MWNHLVSFDATLFIPVPARTAGRCRRRVKSFTLSGAENPGGQLSGMLTVISCTETLNLPYPRQKQKMFGWDATRAVSGLGTFHLVPLAVGPPNITLGPKTVRISGVEMVHLFRLFCQFSTSPVIPSRLIITRTGMDGRRCLAAPTTWKLPFMRF